jgi:dihydropteroate synthase
MPMGRHHVVFGERTLVMGILNATPDSFSGDGMMTGSDWLDFAAAHGERLVDEGADILDVGGESTRPGAPPVAADEERRRVVPLIERLAARVPVPISVDTMKSDVAAAAVAAGAVMINDVSALRFDPQLGRVAAAAGCSVVVMHMQGTPSTMQLRPAYSDTVAEVLEFLEARVTAAIRAGVDRARILVDPGFGFGKSVAHNLEIMRRLDAFQALGCPIVLGPSRKSTIGRLTGGAPPDDRLEGTIALVALAIARGADVVRVHDVRAVARAARVADAVVRGAIGAEP